MIYLCAWLRSEPAKLSHGLDIPVGFSSLKAPKKMGLGGVEAGGPQPGPKPSSTEPVLWPDAAYAVKFR